MRRAFVAGIFVSFASSLWVAGTVLTLLNHYAWRPPNGVRASESLRRVNVTRQGAAGSYQLAPVLSPHELNVVRQSDDGVAVEGYTLSPMYVRNADEQRFVVAGMVTAHFLALLGVRPHLGQLIDAVGSGDLPVAVISDRLWRGLFHGSRGVIGTTVMANGKRWSVVGVTERQFVGIDRTDVDIWLPISLHGGTAAARAAQENKYYLSGVVRVPHLRDTSSIRRRIASALASVPSATPVSAVGLTSIVAERFGGRNLITTLAPWESSFAFGVLALGLGNCVLLLLASAQERQPELRVRSAVGATPARLRIHLAQVPAASMAIAILLVAVSPLFVIPLARGLGFLVPSDLFDPFARTGIAAGGALLGSIVLTLSTLHAGSLDGQARSSVRSGKRPHWPIVAGYVAITAAMTVATAPIVRAYRAVLDLRSGMDTTNTIVVSAVLDTTHSAPQLLNRLTIAVDSLSRMGFVAAASATSSLPYRISTATQISRSIHQRDPVFVYRYSTLGDFFAASGIPAQKQARAPREGNDKAVVINRALAVTLHARRGDCLFVGGDRCSTITAVVGNSDVVALGAPPSPIVFDAMDEAPPSGVVYFLVRTNAAPSAAARRAVSDVVTGVQPEATIEISSLGADLRGQSASLRRWTYVSVALMVFALGLAYLGLRSSVVFSLEQLRESLAIRSAIGASPSSIFGTATGNVTGVACVSAVGGIGLGWVLVRVLVAAVPGMPPMMPRDAAIGFFIPALLVALGVLPAWRMSRIEPLRLLRSSRKRIDA